MTVAARLKPGLVQAVRPVHIVLMAINRLPASKARENFADVLNEVSVRGERIVLERHGKAVAAVISADDLELLEALEDRFDVEAAREALAEAGESVPWEKIKKRLGL